MKLIKRLTYVIMSSLLCSGLLMTATAPVALAAGSSSSTTAKQQVCKGLGEAGASCNDSGGFSKLVSAVVNIISIIVGVAAVIMIVIAGLRYITSGGESGSISGAKNTLIYALVGLVIAALAQFLVHFVLSNISK